MTEEPRHSFSAMHKETDKPPGPDRLKPQQCRGKPVAAGNPRVTEQIRKILRTHYANKYRVR